MYNVLFKIIYECLHYSSKNICSPNVRGMAESVYSNGPINVCGIGHVCFGELISIFANSRGVSFA